VTLADRLQAELTTAMRGHDELRRDTLRMAIAAAYNAAKQARRPLTDDELFGVLGREVKMRRESIEAYEKAGRPDLADRERREAEILTGYLPAAIPEAELQAMMAVAIAETGATTPRDLGRVMGVLAPRTRGRADGKVVSAMVAALLAAPAAAPATAPTTAPTEPPQP
jgi:uncharacterized protein